MLNSSTCVFTMLSLLQVSGDTLLLQQFGTEVNLTRSSTFLVMAAMESPKLQNLQANSSHGKNPEITIVLNTEATGLLQKYLICLVQMILSRHAVGRVNKYKCQENIAKLYMKKQQFTVHNILYTGIAALLLG